MTDREAALTGEVRRSRSNVVPMAAVLTLLAFVVSLGRLFVLGGHDLDWMSPPFATVGLILVVLAVVKGKRPRQLAVCTLILNVAYWCFFVLMTVSL